MNNAKSNNSSDAKEQKTVSQIIDEVRTEICNTRCQYMDAILEEEIYDGILNSRCSNCPLNRL